MKNSFVCEIKKIEQRKLMSLDNQFQIVLVTHDSDLMDWGKIPSDQLVKITIELES